MQPEKVIFLDIDGVIITRRQLTKRHPRRDEDDLYASVAHKADPACIAALNCLCEASEAKIVVSSTWRKCHKDWDALDHVSKLLSVWGARGEVIGVTPVLERDVVITTDAGQRVPLSLAKERGHEIQAWLDKNPTVRQFVILDDEDDMVHLRPYLVQTEFERGLQLFHVERAIALLRR